MAKRADSPEKYSGELTFSDSNGQEITLNIGITTRGLTRRTVCDFPPVKLWFDKEQLKGTIFRGQGSLKMVTHCKATSGFQKYYVKEYLSYRIYNLITDYSFRVRPMMVTYIDSERDSRPFERFGFLIVLGIFFVLPSLAERAGIYLPIAEWLIWKPASLMVNLLFYVTGHLG